MIGISGSRDWLWQRFTAVFLAGYTLFLLGYLAMHAPLRYEAWVALFSGRVMQLSTLFALFAITIHAWIGLWGVLTDYVKPLLLRLFCQALVILALFVYLVWGIFILWGN